MLWDLGPGRYFRLVLGTRAFWLWSTWPVAACSAGYFPLVQQALRLLGGGLPLSEPG